MMERSVKLPERGKEGTKSVRNVGKFVGPTNRRSWWNQRIAGGVGNLEEESWKPDLVSERGGLQSRDFSDIVLTGSVRFSLSPWEWVAKVVEGSLTEGEKFKAKRLGEKKKSSRTMKGLQLERMIMSYNLQGMRGGKGGNSRQVQRRERWYDLMTWDSGPEVFKKRKGQWSRSSTMDQKLLTLCGSSVWECGKI